MKKKIFEDWLCTLTYIETDKYIDSCIDNLEHIESIYGDLDRHYNRDKCNKLLKLFIYTLNEAKHQIRPKHKLFDNLYSENLDYSHFYYRTIQYKKNIENYISFRQDLKKMRIYEQLQITNEIQPSFYNGAYELVEEAVKIFSSIPIEKINSTDLDALWFLCLGTNSKGVYYNETALINCNLSTNKKKELEQLLNKISEKQTNGEYVNSLGRMFDVEFDTFINVVSDDTASDFIKMCIDITYLDEESEILNRASETLCNKLIGIDCFSISKFLHCIKPYIFPIVDRNEQEGETIYDFLGIYLDNLYDSTKYIENTKNLLKFRNENFSFKNFKLMNDIYIETDFSFHMNPKEVSLCWYVDDYNYSSQDKTSYFIKKGIWKNYYKNDYAELINSIQVNDNIALKSNYNQVDNMPFDNKGKSVPVMLIKAIGIVIKKHSDGITIDVEWTKFDKPKKWLLFTSNSPIWKVKVKDDYWLNKALLDFTFMDAPQNIKHFLNIPYWNEIYNDFNLKKEKFSKINISEFNTYTSDDFLQEAFIKKEKYHTILDLLLRKKNIILQGAPGVGKTFIAKRLAYSIIGKMNSEHVKCIQFHQSYSYEDFIMGYKPTTEGFEIKYGVFYNFCKTAESNPKEKYFFIIDEINRGNLSKIFGELLMLIENDKRGEKINLLYTDNTFSIPNNLYIIGTMNTADRSIAIIDYALRRRFCFVSLEPAFELDSFRKYLSSKGVEDDIIYKIITKFTYLNNEISNDLSLGKEFKIGHSYFCNCENMNIDNYNNIIKYEIAPMIKEYWFDDEEKANNYIDKLLR